MTEHAQDTEGALTFLASVAFTIRQIEQAQPEPGLKDLFMKMLHRNAMAAVQVDATQGKATGRVVEATFQTLAGLLVSADVADYLDREP